MSLVRFRTLTLVAPLLLSTVTAVAGCAAKVESRVAREEAASTGLTYHMQIDSTRLRRGSGLSAVASVAELVEDGLSRFFRLRPKKGEPGNSFREIVAESPAPGFGVRATIEERPDDFCLVSIDAVTLNDQGRAATTATVPYSVHFGISAVRAALSSLRQVAWPVMDDETFDLLRKQAATLAESGQDPAIDESTFAHAPRPLQRADDPPRYYAPPQDDTTLRGK